MPTDPELLLAFKRISKAVKGLRTARRFLGEVKKQCEEAEREVQGREKILKKAQTDYAELMEERGEEL
eukprot:3940056-Rhodomonas_salina.2